MDQGTLNEDARSEKKMKELPSFAAQWVEQWKQAAPRLQAIRDEELRRLGSKTWRSKQFAVAFWRATLKSL